MNRFNCSRIFLRWATGIALTMLFSVSLSAETLWSGMIIVDKKSSLHAEGAREKPALASPLIIHVDEQSKAYQDGLRSGDYIIGTAEKFILNLSELEAALEKPVPLKIQSAAGLRVVDYSPSPSDERVRAYLRIKQLMREKGVEAGKAELAQLVETFPTCPMVTFMAGFAFGSVKAKEQAIHCLSQAVRHSPGTIMAKIAAKRLPPEIVRKIETEIAQNPQTDKGAEVANPSKEPNGPGTATNGSTEPASAAVEVTPEPENNPESEPEIDDPGIDTAGTEAGDGSGETMAVGIDPKAFFAAGLDERIGMLRKAIPENPKDKTLREALGGYLLKRVMRDASAKNLDELEPQLQEALDLSPQTFMVQYVWGNLYFNRKNYDGAIPHYEEAVRLSPDDASANAKMGLAFAFVMKYEEAIPFLFKGHQASPKDFFLAYYLGVAHFETKDYEKAMEFLEAAMKVARNENDEKAVMQLMQKVKEHGSSGEGSTVDENQRFIVQFAGDSQRDIGDAVMEMLEDAYDQVTSDLMYKPDIKINVLFFRTEEFYKMGKTPQWAGALAQGAKILVPLKEGYNSGAIKGVLAHEFTHVIINLRTNNRCPTWIHEGLAVYQENKAAYGDPFTLRPDYERVFRETIQTDRKILPLDRITLNYQTQGADISLGYVESYLAMRFLIDRWSWSGVDEMMTSMSQGSHWVQALEDSTGRDLKQFQAEFASWLEGVQ